MNEVRRAMDAQKVDKKYTFCIEFGVADLHPGPKSEGSKTTCPASLSTVPSFLVVSVVFGDREVFKTRPSVPSLLSPTVNTRPIRSQTTELRAPQAIEITLGTGKRVWR